MVYVRTAQDDLVAGKSVALISTSQEAMLASTGQHQTGR
jgi:hypothetical protein